MLTETTGTTPIPLGSPFRFGLGLKQGDVATGNALALRDGASNALAVQFDAINYWPDGSVRFCEVRGYTARSIVAGGTDTISISSAAGAFNNTLPGGKTASQLLTDLQSFSSAQDLIIECDSMTSCSGASNVYTTGNWLAHFNTLLAGSYVQQVNKGPCCMGFRAWGQITNGTINHAHIHVCVYVWLWLDTATGAIKDVEYLVYLHNSLLNQSADGTSYASFPPDRYNYNPVLKNGSTTITAFTLHPGTSSTVGGHHIHAGWWTARSDGKPRWAAGTLEAQNLLVTPDPIQANPQLTITARSYLLSTGLIPKYDVAGVNCTAPPTGTTTPISYAPMIKGLFEDENFSDWNTNVGLNTGGAHATIGMIPQWNVRDLMLQTKTTAQNHRVSALGWTTLPSMHLDINGRIPNVRNQDYTGMTPHQPLTFSSGDQDPYYRYSVTPSTEHASGAVYSYGNWNWAFQDTTHYPSGAYYTYLMEGGAHNRDIVLMGAHFVVMALAPDQSIFPGGAWPAGAGPVYTCRTPVLSGTTYYGNVLATTTQIRQEAWAMRELVFAAAVAPAALADGTMFGEGLYFKGLMQGSFEYAQALLGILPTNQITNGFWNYVQSNSNSPQTPVAATSGTDSPWMNTYFAEVLARAQILHGGEAFGASVAAMVAMHKKYIAGISNAHCSILASAQEINIRNGGGSGTGATFKTSWNLVGTFPTQVAVTGGDIWMFASFNDTSTGWITLFPAHSATPSWPEVPFDVGASLIFTIDYNGNTFVGQQPAPPPFVMETQTYYVVAAESANSRIKVSTTPGGAPVIPITTATTVLWCLLDLASCPATYNPVPTSGATSAYLGFQDVLANMANLSRAVRSYRAANDSVDLQAADTTVTARLVSAGVDYTTWPMGKLLL
jgi:hypothetical protein